MKKQILMSDIKDMQKVFTGITYASNGYEPPVKYKDDEEFMIGYNLSKRLQSNAPVVVKKSKTKKNI